MTSTSPALPRGFPGYVALLRGNPDVRNIWTAQIVSQIGDWFNSVALLGLINQLTPDPIAPVLVTVFALLPSALAGLTISGYLADRIDRKKLAIVMDIARAVVALMLLLVYSTNTLWIAYAAIITLSVGESVFYACLAAAQPNLCRPHELAAANALQQSTWASVSLVGAALGGLTAQYLGREVAFVINALSFLGSAYFLLQVRGPFSLRKEGASGTSFRDLTEGFRFLLGNHRVLAFSVVKAIWAFSFAATGLYSVYAFRVYQMGDMGTSWLFVARGLGSFFGPVLLQSIFTPQTNKQFAWVIAGGLVLCVLGYGMWALSPFVWLGALGIFIGHLGGGNVWTYSRIFVQREAPDKIRGRVMSLDSVGFTLVTGVYAFVIGAVARYTTPTWGVLAGVLATMLLGAIWFVWMWRNVIKNELQN